MTHSLFPAKRISTGKLPDSKSAGRKANEGDDNSHEAQVL